MMWKLLLFTSICYISVQGQYYEDKRCRCVCPNPASVLNNTQKTNRRLYIAYVLPNQCNCDGVILPRVTNEIKEQAQLFCPHCECKYETRNSTVIMVVVIIVLWMITLLLGYLFFLVTLDPLIKKRHVKFYEECATEESPIVRPGAIGFSVAQEAAPQAGVVGLNSMMDLYPHAMNLLDEGEETNNEESNLLIQC